MPEAKTENRSPRLPSILWGQIFQFLAYVGICAWLIRLVASGSSQPEVAAKLDTIIFTDFFGYFLISLLFRSDSKSVRWVWPMSSDEILRIVGYILLILVAGWFMEGVAGWPLTLAWMLGLLTSLTDVESLRIGAIIRVVWAISSGFLVALVGSIAGVPEESLLENHVPTLFAWGLLYFGGVALFRLVRIWLVGSG